MSNGKGLLVPGDMHPERDVQEQSKKSDPSHTQLAVAAFAVLALGAGSLYVSLNPKAIALSEKEIPLVEEPAQDKVVSESGRDLSTFNPFEGISIEGKAAVVWDVTNREIIYSQSENEQLPLASLSKIMTALIAYENLDENSTIVIHADDLETEGDSGLFLDERWKLTDLLDFMLVVSSNDGSEAVASAIESIKNIETPPDTQRTAFIDIMNAKARELNMHQTYFLNASGLDVDETALSGSYGSAKDITLLVDYTLRTYPRLFEATGEDEKDFMSLSNFSHEAENTNIAVNEIPGLIASKTGYTELAGGNLVIAFDAGLGQPYIITVLGSTKDERFNDVIKLRKATQRYVTQSSGVSGTTPAATIKTEGQ